MLEGEQTDSECLTARLRAVKVGPIGFEPMMKLIPTPPINNQAGTKDTVCFNCSEVTVSTPRKIKP